MAYIPDQDLYYSKIQRSKISAQVKLIRLMKLFSVALESFIAAQQPGAMDNSYLVLGDRAKYVNLMIPLSFIIGDNQGGDNISGRTCHYGITAKRISRCCDATPANYSDVSKDSCSFLHMAHIMQLVDDEEWEDLDALYQANFWNPFFDVDYGANPHGIFLAACPPEGLHALEQGVFKHLLEEILGVYLKPEQIAILDRVVQSWVGRPRQRLFRSANFTEAPRLMFRDGISSLSNTPGCDRAGMVFALAMSSLTRDGHSAFARLDDNVTVEITYALEMLLCYWAWLKKDKYWQLDSAEQLESVKDAVSTMLHEVTTCIPRFQGNGWNIPKIHEQLHVPYYIQMFGAHRNLHTGVTEHNHITLSKEPAGRTQMRANVFDIQVANRLIDKFVVDLATFNMAEEEVPTDTIIPTSTYIPHNSAVFDMLLWTDIEGVQHADIATPNSHGKYMPSMDVLECLFEYCSTGTHGTDIDGAQRIRCVTELAINDQHLRANMTEKDGCWFDNIVLNQEPDPNGIVSTIAGNLRFMFFFPDTPQECFGVIHSAYSHHPQYSVLSHMYRMEYLDDPPDIINSPEHFDRGEGCWVLDKDKHLLDSSPRLSVIELCNLASHLLMIPYHDHSKFMIGVMDQSLWSDSFVTY